MRVLILGGDGYLGWPTAMSFSNKGHDVWAVDNYLRRHLCTKHDVEPLYPIPNLIERARLWKDISGKEITVRIGDCTDYSFLSWKYRGKEDDFGDEVDRQQFRLAYLRHLRFEAEVQAAHIATVLFGSSKNSSGGSAAGQRGNLSDFKRATGRRH